MYRKVLERFWGFDVVGWMCKLTVVFKGIVTQPESPYWPSAARRKCEPVPQLKRNPGSCYLCDTICFLTAFHIQQSHTFKGRVQDYKSHRLSSLSWICVSGDLCNVHLFNYTAS